ncbi:MAG: TerB family tellurite resistance protein, partial [Hydrocarboniphaga effusa]|nr:TerB family tellurite resistance protein [Hydrocarboniphaga effusa]
ALLGLLWRVAYADGKLEANEEHLLRRLSDLLHLSHGDFIRARHAAEKG